MPSSAKVHFKLETLKAKALESIDERIAIKEVELNETGDPELHKESLAAWRSRQEERISELFRQLGDIDDYRLSGFALDPIPRVDPWERNKVERELRSLHAIRSQIVAKSESLVADEKGEISLTSTQLKDFFDL
jgi:HPt (histidine-containing phosphotransfer) domain-containing protein